MKVGLDSKSGISKFLHAREYRKAARDAYRFAKVTFACDLLYGIYLIIAITESLG